MKFISKTSLIPVHKNISSPIYNKPNNRLLKPTTIDPIRFRSNEKASLQRTDVYNVKMRINHPLICGTVSLQY